MRDWECRKQERNMMSVERVFVVGSGLMGSGIAQVCAQAGLSVVLHDVKPDALRKSLEKHIVVGPQICRKGSCGRPGGGDHFARHYL